MEGSQISRLPDGKRLHLHHGPIDLIVEAVGQDRERAYCLAIERFETILEELVEELPALRSECQFDRHFSGQVATAMQRTVELYSGGFVTPMAAVAGAVADEILRTMCDGTDIVKAYVNNGGDIAFHLTEHQTMKAAMAGVPGGVAEIGFWDATRGIATSGWRGRSFSFGISDSVSVLAANAAKADVAATLIANAIDLPNSSKIQRSPANELSPDSDLGNREVTVDVAPLSDQEVSRALAQGVQLTQQLIDKKLIAGACLQLQRDVRCVGTLSMSNSNSLQRRELSNA